MYHCQPAATGTQKIVPYIATQNDKNYILSYQNDLERNLDTYQISNLIIVEGVLIKGFWMERNIRFDCPASFANIYGNITLIRLGFLKVVLSGGRANLTPFIFQEEVIQYQHYCIQLQQPI